MSTYQYNVGSTPKIVKGTLGWNPNGTLGSLLIADAFDPANAQNCGYTYDDVARLQSVSCGPTNRDGTTWGQTFAYDPFGNISKSVPLGMTGISWLPGYNTNNRYTLGGTSYDGNGNLTNDTFNTYAWDSDGNTFSVNLINVTYDAFDRIVEENNSGTYKQILYSPIGKLAVMAKQVPTNVFVPLPGGEQATYTSQTIRFRHYDWQGSARFESNMAEQEYGDLAYAPFGETYAIKNTPYLSFTGQQQDTVAGTYDFLYREYNPVQGRWIRPDPAGLAAVDPSNPQSWNRYAYALNNPLSYVDPTGLYCEYFGESDESDLGASFDFHSNSGECGDNGGTWFDDAKTTVTVNGTTGDVDTLSIFTGNEGLTPNVTVQRSFDRSFPCKQTAGGAMNNLQNNFPASANWQWGPLHVTFLQHGSLMAGSMIPIDGPIGAWASLGGSPAGFLHAATSAVTVASVNSNSFTLATVPGMHPFDNGTVRFSASDAANGNINFGVDVNGAFADPLSKFAFNYGMKAVEASIWHNLMNNVQAGCR